MTGRLETEAYDWDDTIALLSQGPGLVDNNVDNLAMMILSEWKSCFATIALKLYALEDIKCGETNTFAPPVAFMRQNSWDKNGLARSMGQVANDCSLP